jgi:hypothetical protein
MRYYDLLQEIEVIDSLETNPDPSIFISNAENLGDNIKRKQFGNQKVYSITFKNKVIAYAIIQNNNEHIWLLEIWTDMNNRGKGLAVKLIKRINKEHKRIFVDLKMSKESIQMIEHLISKGTITVGIVDFEKGEIKDYNPDSYQSQQFPMYDRKIDGIVRQPLPPEKALSFGWVILENTIRRGILSPYIRKTNLPDITIKKTL